MWLIPKHKRKARTLVGVISILEAFIHGLHEMV